MLVIAVLEEAGDVPNFCGYVSVSEDPTRSGNDHDAQDIALQTPDFEGHQVPSCTWNHWPSKILVHLPALVYKDYGTPDTVGFRKPCAKASQVF